MAKSETYTTKHDDIEFSVHNTSIDNGKTPVGRIAIPVCTTFEKMAELSELGYFGESEICSLAMQQLVIREQGKLRARMSPKARVTAADACDVFADLTPEEFQEYAGNAEKLATFIKSKKQQKVDKKDFDPDKVWWLEAKNE